MKAHKSLEGTESAPFDIISAARVSSNSSSVPSAVMKVPTRLKRKAEGAGDTASVAACVGEEVVVGGEGAVEGSNTHPPRSKRARREVPALPAPPERKYHNQLTGPSDQLSFIASTPKDTKITETTPIEKKDVGQATDRKGAIQRSVPPAEERDLDVAVNQGNGSKSDLGREAAHTTAQELYSYHGAADANAASTKMKPETCVIKASCRYGWETRTRYLSISSDVKFMGFKEFLADVFRMKSPFVLRFKDDEGDEVTMASDEELDVLFRIAPRLLLPVRVELVRPNDGKNIFTNEE